MFDWATQPFYTLGLTCIFAPYFVSVTVEYFFNIGQNQASAEVSAQSMWAWGQTITGLIVAFLGLLAEFLPLYELPMSSHRHYHFK